MRFARPKQTMIIPVASVVIVIGILLAGYLWLFSRPNGTLKGDEVRIGSSVFTVEVASTTIEQARGLSFRTSLAENNGMLFLFPTAGIKNFWMKDMNFPIDIIWIADGKVAGIVKNAAPQPGVALWQLTIFNSPDGVDKVLEVNAGTADRDGIAEGDEVVIAGGTE